jgi:arginase
LKSSGKAMDVRILLVPYDSAQRSARMGQGPEHWTEHGLADQLQAAGRRVQIDIIETTRSFRAEIATAFDLNRNLAAQVHEAHQQGEFPLVLSGNCNSALGTCAGSDPTNLGVIWLDAHDDFATPATTKSGFLDGMGLATLAGQGWERLVASIPGFRPVDETRIMHVGGREIAQITQSKAAVIPAADIRANGIQQALLPALQALQAGVQRVYFHLDVDVLDPTIGSANGFAVPGGLLVEQVLEIIELVRAHVRIVACGVASYDPSYDPQDAILQAGFRLIRELLP